MEENRSLSGRCFFVTRGVDKYVRIIFDEPYKFKYGGKAYSLSGINVRKESVRGYLEGNSVKLPRDFVRSFLGRKMAAETSEAEIFRILAEGEK